MYDKKIKEEFWTTFGRYMALNPSASGEKVNWINYKTGVKHIQFRLFADDKMAAIYIELSNANPESQKKLLDQFIRDKDLLEAFTNDSWQMQPHVTTGDGRTISRVYQEHEGVNVYFKSDWPAIISFLKSQLTGLDKFWHQQRDLYSFIADQ